MAAERCPYSSRADWPQTLPLLDDEDVGGGSPAGRWGEKQEESGVLEGEVGPQPGCCLQCVVGREHPPPAKPRAAVAISKLRASPLPSCTRVVLLLDFKKKKNK